MFLSIHSSRFFIYNSFCFRTDFTVLKQALAGDFFRCFYIEMKWKTKSCFNIFVQYFFFLCCFTFSGFYFSLSLSLSFLIKYAKKSGGRSYCETEGWSIIKLTFRWGNFFPHVILASPKPQTQKREKLFINATQEKFRNCFFSPETNSLKKTF
jgi:hypothetical protein